MSTTTVNDTATARLAVVTREHEAATRRAGELRQQIAQATAIGASAASRAKVRAQYADALALVQELSDAVEILTREAEAEREAEKREAAAAAASDAAAAHAAATMAFRALEETLLKWARETLAPLHKAALEARAVAAAAHDLAGRAGGLPGLDIDRYEVGSLFTGAPDPSDDRARETDFYTILRYLDLYARHPAAPSNS